MYNIYLIFYVLTLPIVARGWDLAVASGDMLEFMTFDGQVISIASQEFKELTGVAYDRDKEHLYLTDAGHENGSVFRMDLSTSKLTTLVPRQKVAVQGIAFDPVSTTLYWTSGNGKTISMLHLVDDNPTVPQTLHKFEQEIPMGIVVDHCKRFLYWANGYHRNPSIERSALDGSNVEVIHNTDLFQPFGISIDQTAEKLYWSDDREGIHFKIECSDLDGTNRKTVYHGRHQQPFSLTVGPNHIFWTDWVYKAVWSSPKDNHQQDPTMVKRYRMGEPMGLVAQISTECPKPKLNTAKVDITTLSHEIIEDTSTSHVILPSSVDEKFVGHCLNNGVMKGSSSECECALGYSGQQCEIPVCYSYCLRGSCYIDIKGFPQCKCPLGYKGDRCHIDVCESYCLNGGRCIVGDGGRPVCTCDNQFRGQRCERSRDYYLSNFGHYEISDNVENVTSSIIVRNNVTAQPLCSSQDLDEYIFLGLGAVISIQIVIMFLLVRKVYILRKRPRIKKRIIVNKNVRPTPLTSRPLQGEQCEITIENCCNMNICETPCFEPQLRTSKTISKTEEKKNLLGSMEEAQHCSPSHENLY